MSVTIKDIKRQFLTAEKVEQFRSMQLFIAYFPKGRVLISYYTPVGYYSYINGWSITTKKYSRSTSRQITMFSRDSAVTRISQEKLEIALECFGI